MCIRDRYSAEVDGESCMTREGKVIMPERQVRFADTIIVKIYQKDDPIPRGPILMTDTRSILKDGRNWNSRARASGYIPKGKYMPWRQRDAQPKRVRRKTSF